VTPDEAVVAVLAALDAAAMPLDSDVQPPLPFLLPRLANA
jgi:hypothetical protein